jgi:CMP-2-keto-3-deoxyoctulosonic acid synthetase
MKYLGVIPARLGSTRLERKPLQSLKNKPLILWVCEAVQKSKKLDKFVVATDSTEVLDVVVHAGFEAQLTSENCPSGTDRVLEVAKKYDPQFIINIQGDEPLIKASEIDGLLEFIESKDQDCWATLGHELSLEDLDNKNAVKVVVNKFLFRDKRKR